ncbi:MAG: cysteine hydrolase [Candidatus Moranbacteria bacterium]|nr:cysteine hydrolase [Candidatus Moranbacteria bacterium]
MSLTNHASKSPQGRMPVVILIDMQTGFFPGIREERKEQLVASQRSILCHCADQDIPVCVLEFNNYGETIPELADLLAKIPRVKTLLKSHDDGFTNPELKETLDGWEAEKLIIMGINADYCVLETAKSAIRNEFQIVTAPSLIAGLPSHSEDDSIDWYSRNGTVRKRLLPLVRNVA